MCLDGPVVRCLDGPVVRYVFYGPVVRYLDGPVVRYVSGWPNGEVCIWMAQ